MLLLTILLQTPIDDPNEFNSFLILGYVAMWLIGMAYLVYLLNRQRNISQDIRVLRQLLEDDDQTQT
jgi:hypothetical protein